MIKVKHILPIIFVIIFLTGCTVKREIIMPDNTTYVVKVQKDDMITFKKDGLEIIVDGRGRPGMFEQILSLMFMNLPDLTLESD